MTSAEQVLARHERSDTYATETLQHVGRYKVRARPLSVIKLNLIVIVLAMELVVVLYDSGMCYNADVPMSNA